jgi:hypothetical protein
MQKQSETLAETSSLLQSQPEEEYLVNLSAIVKQLKNERDRVERQLQAKSGGESIFSEARKVLRVVV